MDDGSLAAVHLSRGAWDRVHMARLPSDWSVELERLQAFGRVTRPAGAPGRMFVDAPAWMRRGAAASAGIEWLAGSGRQVYLPCIHSRRRNPTLGLGCDWIESNP